jgi:hypothetical protein
MPGRRADGEDERASADQLIGTCCGTPTLCTRGTKHNRPTIQKAIDQHETRNSSVWVLIVPPGLDTTWTSGPLRLRPAPVGWLGAAASAAFPAAWVQARRSSRPQTMMALANASQNSTTVLPRSVHPRSLPYRFAQAWVRSITPPATGLDRCRRPRMAIWPTIPRSPKTCRHGGSS